MAIPEELILFPLLGVENRNFHVCKIKRKYLTTLDVEPRFFARDEVHHGSPNLFFAGNLLDLGYLEVSSLSLQHIGIT